MVLLTSCVNDRKRLKIFWRFNTHFSKFVDIQILLQQFASNPDLSIVDLQMLVGRDGQLYVIDPANSDFVLYLIDFLQILDHDLASLC
jgi:hypothetical protein